MNSMNPDNASAEGTPPSLTMPCVMPFISVMSLGIRFSGLTRVENVA